jgi:Tfp pilus assembly protein PilF
MRGLLLLLILFIPATLLFAQVNNTVENKNAGTGNTYAVVVGISKYESMGIPQLEYAHKDALFFANYLKSKAGGAVPEENIRLLVNESATYAAIYDALDWLLTTCHKDDLVYFYFSGHGDMENSTIYKLGFLLSYNTPRTNYINNAVRIEDLNNIANTLSVKVNAKVVLITDACHSGKLAGTDYRGTFLVGDQLRTVQKKEIRITSCAPDQLSAEDEGWGGGRGVFSYYLVNGLEGMADNDQDKIVTVNEIKNYLDSSLAVDALLAQKAMKQSPVIKGNNDFTLATVDNVSLASLKKQTAPIVLTTGSAPQVMSALKPLPMQPQTFFFNFLQKQNPEDLTDFNALNKLAKEEIPFACLRMLADSIKKGSALFAGDGTKNVIDTGKINLLEKTLRENKDALNRFNNKLAVLLSDRGQEIINLYLEGDAAELERRNYYNSKSNGYDIYPKMFSVALKLTAPENYLYQILQVKLHYFSGIAARLKMPTVENFKPLLDTAIAEQKKAFELEENAAYIQNELGILYLAKNDLPAAEKYFLRATQIAPQWALPWSNLSSLYTSTKNYPKATDAAKTAMDLQPGFQGTYISSGYLNEQKGKLLTAEELFMRGIQINSRHYLPFERLGYVYMNTTQYERADSFFYEADKRKKGFHFKPNDKKYLLGPYALAATAEAICPFDSLDVGKEDIMGHFVWAKWAFKTGNLPTAEKEFKKVIALDKANPLAFHWLGSLLYKQQRWEEAAIIFNYAVNYYLDTMAFRMYCDSLAKKMADTKSKPCFIIEFKGSLYPQIEDHYYAGRLYELWDHFGEAEAAYRKIISMDTVFMGGYYLLWNMLEKMGRYNDAEEVIRRFTITDNSTGQRELNGFYNRMTKRFPDRGEWCYKAGLLLYHVAATGPQLYPYDKKKIEPDTHVEKYLVAGFARPPEEEGILPAINENIHAAGHIDFPRTQGIAYLKMADSLLANDEDALADINYKIGDLYVWQGLQQKAPPYYKKSVDLKPDNANTRLKLIDICDSTYQFTDAMAQLDSLYRRHEIDFAKQVLMAKYYIHESRFTEAGDLLKTAQQIHPYKIPAITDLNGRLQLLSGQPKIALTFYKDYLALNPGNAATMYTIARIYAQTGNKAEAWKWLEMAMNKGFNYGWVLKFDTAWNTYRKQGRWAVLQKKFPAKEYEGKQP